MCLKLFAESWFNDQNFNYKINVVLAIVAIIVVVVLLLCRTDHFLKVLTINLKIAFNLQNVYKHTTN